MKFFVTKRLPKMTRLLYNQDWSVLVNKTETLFITSDNPSAFIPKSNPLKRILPVSPSLCLYAENNMSFSDTDHFDLRSPPNGSFTFTSIARRVAMTINRITVLNANDLVFSQSTDVGIAALVKKYRDFRPQVEPASFSADHAALKGATLTIGPP
ncbi:MAG: DUF4238 domain-containing protein [Methylocella sp.]